MNLITLTSVYEGVHPAQRSFTITPGRIVRIIAGLDPDLVAEVRGRGAWRVPRAHERRHLGSVARRRARRAARKSPT